MAAKIRRDDEVVVIAGKDKGRRGKVLQVRPDNRVLVSGVNLMKKHMKPNPMLGKQGGIVEKEDYHLGSRKTALKISYL